MSAVVARIDRQPAFVLHRRSFRETSFLLELLTRDHGRVGVVARAARSARRGGASALQPFQPLLASWSGRGELKTLTAAETVTTVPSIAGERLYSALYVNELLVRLLPQNDAHAALFDAYATLLPELASAAELEAPLRRFELLLLRELGYGLEFARDAASGAILEPAASYVFAPGEGFRPAEAPADPCAYPGQVLTAIGCEDFSDPHTRRYAKRLIRAALAELLGPRPLHSRGYFGSSSRARPAGQATE